MEKPIFTVFTPCYNCEDTMPTVAKCICNQTFKDFEWIIYNDGSSDDSDNVIKNIVSQYTDITIKYIDGNINRGKHIAWNRVLDMAAGELFVIADADDPIEMDSLQFLYKKWEETKNDKKCCGVLGLADYIPSGELCTKKKWPSEGFECNYLDMEYKYNTRGETWGFTKTSILRERHFPELYKGYFPESYIWWWLAEQGYYYKCYNKVLRHYYLNLNGICHTNRRYMTSQVLINIYYYMWQIKHFTKYLIIKSPFTFILIVLKLISNISKYLFVCKEK